jgi:hypothetical protein
VNLGEKQAAQLLYIPDMLILYLPPNFSSFFSNCQIGDGPPEPTKNKLFRRNLEEGDFA